MRILFIDDNKETSETVQAGLKGDYIVELADSGHSGEELVRLNEYDLILIDIHLPDKSGIDVCKTIRKEGYVMPILMLTGEYETKTKIIALDGGADDYLTKPYVLAELKARIRSLLRRKTAMQRTSILQVSGLSLDLEKRIAYRGNTVIHIGRKEFAILEYMMLNAGKALSRDMIFSHVWDSSADPMYNTIDVHIKYLRDRIDRKFSKKLIKTIYGFGYKLEV